VPDFKSKHVSFGFWAVRLSERTEREQKSACRDQKMESNSLIKDEGVAVTFDASRSLGRVEKRMNERACRIVLHSLNDQRGEIEGNYETNQAFQAAIHRSSTFDGCGGSSSNFGICFKMKIPPEERHRSIMSQVEFKSVADALAELTRKGFTETFRPAESRLHCDGNGRDYEPSEVTIMQVYRFEGESDPDDMSVVYALETKDGARGTIVDAFGAYGASEVGDSLRSLKVKEASGAISPRQDTERSV
jgi:hypothetical protein